MEQNYNLCYQRMLSGKPDKLALIRQLQCAEPSAPSAHWGDEDTLMLMSVVFRVGFVVLKMRLAPGEVHELIEADGCTCRAVLVLDTSVPHYHTTVRHSQRQMR